MNDMKQRDDTMKRPTPETDVQRIRSSKYDGEEIPGFDYVDADFASELECQRDEAREEAANKTESIQIAANRIDELKKRSDHWCDMHTIAAKERDEVQCIAREMLAELERLSHWRFPMYAEDCGIIAEIDSVIGKFEERMLP